MHLAALRTILLFIILLTSLPAYGLYLVSPTKEQPEIKIEITTSFDKGQNDRDAKDLLKENEATLLQNASILKAGLIEKRKGITVLGNDLGSASCLGLGRHTHTTAGERYLTAFTTIAYKLNSAESAFTSISTGLTTGLSTYFLSAGDYAFIMNGTDRIRYYDAAAETVTTFGSGATDPPLAKYGVYARNRVFLVDEGNQSRLRYSDAGAPLTYQAISEIQVNEDDGQRINGLLVYGGDLLVFKERSIWSINIDASDYITNLQIEKVDNQYGTLAPRSIKQLGKDIIFLDQFGNVRSLSRTALGELESGTAILSDKVKGTLSKNFAPTTSGINRQYINLCAAEVWEDEYILAYPDGTSTYDNKAIRWNATFGAWTTITGWNVSCFDRWTIGNTDYLIMGEASADSLVYKGFQGVSDNGAAIDFDAQTKEYRTDWIGEKEWQLAEITTDTDSAAGDLTIQVNLDSGGWQTLGTLDMAGNAPTLPVTLPFNLGSDAIVKQKYHLENYGRTDGIQFRFRNNTATDNVILRQLILFARALDYSSE